MGRGGRWDWNADAVQRLSLVKWIRTGAIHQPLPLANQDLSAAGAVLQDPQTKSRESVCLLAVA